MAPDDHDRLRLLRRLEEVLGPEEAAILMTNLPPERWTELATRRDLEAIMTRFDDVDRRFDDVDRRFDTVDQRFNAVDRRFDAIDQRFDAVDARFQAVDARIDAAGHDVQALGARFDAVHARFDAFGHRVDGLRSELIATVEGAFRRQLWALLALMIALATLVLATAELVR
jgi:tetrahydromethanopterin S-methyltransferase subunit G